MSELIYIAAPYAHPDASVVQARMEEIYITMGMFIQAGKHVITPLAMHEVVIRHDMEDDYNI